MVESVRLRDERMARDGFESSVWRREAFGEHAAGSAAVRVAILALPQASVANIAAVYEDLQSVNMLPSPPNTPPRFAVRIVAESTEPRRALSGLTLTPQRALDEERYDAVVIPTLFDDGCLSDPDYGPILTDRERAWLRAQHDGGALFSTMCSGAYALADAGLLDGCACAMHWLYCEAFGARFPEVQVVPRRTLVVSGARREFVSGGVSVYSADVSLFNIARFLGPETALHFATLYGRSWSEALHAQVAQPLAESETEDRVVALAKRFFLDHLAGSGLVNAAAELANLAPRTLCRRFQRATGVSPRTFITTARMERARALLSRGRMPIEDVAAKVGYADRSAFAKTFREKTGLAPARYRGRFQDSVGLNAAGLAAEPAASAPDRAQPRAH